MPDLKQSTATTRLILMVDSSDHVTGKTGLGSLTITASKAGGAFATITPTVVERGNGYYSLALTSAHTDTLGDLAIHVAASGADPADKLFNVVAGSLDADVSSRLAPTAPGRTLDVSATGEAGIDWGNVGSPTATLALSATTISASQGVASVSGAVGSVAGNVSGSVASVAGDVAGKVLGGGSGTITGTGVNASISAVDPALTADGTAQAGASTTITLASSASATDDAYNGRTIDIVAGTGVGQSRKIADYVGSTRVATVDLAWVTTPDNTSKYALGSYVPAATVSGNVTVGGYAAGQDPATLTWAATTRTITGGTVANATNLTNLPAVPTDWLTAAGVKADAVAKVQSGLSTYAGADTSGTTTLLSRLSSTRAGLLDNLDAAVSTRSTYSGGSVTVGGYATGQDPATLVLATPANKIATDNTGKVVTSNPATSGSDPSALADALATRIATDHGSGSYANPPTVTLAASQPNYAPARAGDAMTLTTAYDPAKSTAPTSSAITSAVVAGMATAPVGSVANLLPILLPGGTVLASPAPTSTAFRGTGTSLNASSAAYAPTDKRVRFVLWQTGANAGETSSIASYAGNGSFTLDSAPTGTIASGDAFLVI